jgi:hypothetical protein
MDLARQVHFFGATRVRTATIRVYPDGALILHYPTAGDVGPATIRARPGGALIFTRL